MDSKTFPVLNSMNVGVYEHKVFQVWTAQLVGGKCIPEKKCLWDLCSPLLFAKWEVYLCRKRVASFYVSKRVMRIFSGVFPRKEYSSFRLGYGKGRKERENSFVHYMKCKQHQSRIRRMKVTCVMLFTFDKMDHSVCVRLWEGGSVNVRE